MMVSLAWAFVVASCLAWAGPSHAAEGPRDVETDHRDAYDDGGKPTFALFANPGALLGGGLSGQFELALGDAVALGLEAQYVALGPTRAYAVSLAAPLFVECVRFHGLYVEPRVLAGIAEGGSVSSAVFGLGATAGWEETWRFGLSIKAGIGLAYEEALDGSGLVVRPLVDAAVGWVF